MKHVINIKTVEMITRHEGCVILDANCTSPLPEQYFESYEKFRTEHKGWLQQAVLNTFENNCRIIKDASPERNLSVAQLMLALNDSTLIPAPKDAGLKQAKPIGLKTDAN